MAVRNFSLFFSSPLPLKLTCLLLAAAAEEEEEDDLEDFLTAPLAGAEELSEEGYLELTPTTSILLLRWWAEEEEVEANWWLCPLPMCPW